MWTVFYRPPSSSPRLKLSQAILDDPAFSPDPRSHPHHAIDLLPSPPPPPPPPRKAKMRAFIRRLTVRRNLDRIDELDESDPFGGGYHHDGPYEAIASTLPQSAQPRRRSDPPPRRAEFDPRVRPDHHRSAPQVPSAHDGMGLSLHLEPGQILQQNTVYNSHVPSQTIRQVASLNRPDHSRSRSVPYVYTPSPHESSSLDSFPNRPALSLTAPRERYLRDDKSDISITIPPHDVAPYVHHQLETTFLPPPRYESRLHSFGPLQSPQRPPSPSTDPPQRRARSTGAPVPALPPLAQKSVHSVDSSYASSTTLTQSSLSVRHQSLEPPRVRHLPKRLVMPAPLQPQPLQPPSQHAEPEAWQDESLAVHTLNFQGKPTTYSHEPRLLRKRSSAFPAKTPIPDHAPTSQDDPVPTISSFPIKSTNETEGTKEGTRRRRLSKRKNDI